MAWPFSVLILAFNEEANLPACLESVKGCDDVVVLDSGSTDATVEIARAAGARVFLRPFDDFGSQRNHAQDSIAFRHAWVFHLDADERMTPELAAECSRSVAPESVDGWYAAPRMIFMGRWIRHCTDYPAWQARFVRAPGFKFISVGHGQREAPGMRMGFLKSGYLHEAMPHGQDEWLKKHRRYAVAEAREYLAARSSTLSASPQLNRRRRLKRLSYSLPFRPLARFLYQYFLRLGFLDGRPGLRYCLLLFRYEGFVAQELAQTKTHSP